MVIFYLLFDYSKDKSRHIDLYITRRKIQELTPIRLTWVRGYSDKQPWKLLDVKILVP